MKTILLPTDFSTNSRNAIDYAIRAFGDGTDKFVLLNAFIVPHAGASTMISIEDMMRKDSEKKMKNFLEDIKEDYHDVKLDIEAIVEYGDVVLAIEKVQELFPVDMVIMGTHGASGFKVLLGSNTAAVVKNIKVPVIAVPENVSFERPKKILLAIDNKEKIGDDVWDPLITLIEKWKAQLIILNVQPVLVPVDAAPIQVKVPLALKSLPHFTEDIKDEDIALGISDYADENDVDLVAVVARHHNFIEKIFGKSVSRSLVMHTHKPTLILHE